MVYIWSFMVWIMIFNSKQTPVEEVKKIMTITCDTLIDKNKSSFPLCTNRAEILKVPSTRLSNYGLSFWSLNFHTMNFMLLLLLLSLLFDLSRITKCDVMPFIV